MQLIRKDKLGKMVWRFQHLTVNLLQYTISYYASARRGFEDDATQVRDHLVEFDLAYTEAKGQMRKGGVADFVDSSVIVRL